MNNIIKDWNVLRMFLTLMILVSLCGSIDWGDVWFRVWDILVSLLLLIWIWTVEIFTNEEK